MASVTEWFQDTFLGDPASRRRNGMLVAPATPLLGLEPAQTSSSSSPDDAGLPSLEPPVPQRETPVPQMETPAVSQRDFAAPPQQTAIYPSLSPSPIPIGSAPPKQQQRKEVEIATPRDAPLEWRETTEGERVVSWFTQRVNIVRLNYTIACSALAITAALSIRMYMIVKDL